MKFDYDIPVLVPYINWPYFYFAWQVKAEQEKALLRAEAQTFLENCSEHYHAHALFVLFDAFSDGDDMIVAGDKRIPMLRQQDAGSGYHSLADFVAPSGYHGSESPIIASKVGLFATSVDMGMETDFSAPVLLYVFLLGAVQVGLAYIFFTTGTRYTDPVTASIINAMEPILNPVLVAVFYGEMLGKMSLAGAGIVICGILYYNLKKIYSQRIT